MSTPTTHDETDILDGPEAGQAVVQGGTIRLVGFLAGFVLSLVSLVLVTRHLSPAAFNQFQTVSSLLVIVQVATDVGLGALGLREYAHLRGAERERFLATLVGLRLALVLVGTTAAVAILAAAGAENAVVAGTLAGGLALAALVVQSAGNTPLQANLQLGRVTALDFLRQLSLAAAYAAVVVLGGGLFPLLAMPLVANVIVLAATAWLVRGVYSLRVSMDVRAWRRLAAGAVGFGLASSVGVSYQYLGQLLVSAIAKPDIAGAYAAAFRAFSVLTMVAVVVVSSSLPILTRAARDDHGRLAYAIDRLTVTVTMVGVAAGIVLAVGAPLAPAVIGSAYAETVPILRVQAITIVITFACTAWGFSLMALRAHRSMVKANLAAIVALLILMPLFIQRYDAVGAAIASVLGEAVLAAGYAVALRNAGSALTPPLRTPAALVLVGALATVLGLVLPVAPLAGSALALLTYGVMILGCGLVPAELRALLQRNNGAGT